MSEHAQQLSVPSPQVAAAAVAPPGMTGVPGRETTGPSSVPGRGPLPGGASPASDGQVHAVAAQAIRGGGSSLPFFDRIQRAFGRHDISSILAHVGGDATTAAQAIGADAFAMGEHVAFSRAPDLRMVAHEVAHVIQQRAGISIAVGAAGDAHEQHADRVAELVASGQSAEAELDRYTGAGSAPRGGSVAVQRIVGANLNVGDPVTIAATGAPGAIAQHYPVQGGYDVQHMGGLHGFTYAQLDPRNAGAWVNQVVTTFPNAGAAVGWATHDFPGYYEDLLADRPKLIVCAPSARGDMHDIRPALMMDADLKIIIAFNDDNSPLAQDWRGDVNTIVGYYQGIPNFQQRVAVINTADAGGVRAALNGIGASDSTRILRVMQNQNGQAQLTQDLADATTGPVNADDEFDCLRALIAAGFNATDSYVLVNSRDSGHNPGNRPASHPEHDSGAQGYWDMISAVQVAGHVPVPMGAMPGLANWPGASLVNYFNWPACQANARRNKRQAEYYLLAALKRFNPHVYALAWRSGVTDAIAFAGIPVIALDVDNTIGHERAQSREDLLGVTPLGDNHYTQLDMSDRVAAEGMGGPQLGVAGWLGPLPRNDMAAIANALGNGPNQQLMQNLAHTPAPPPLQPFGVPQQLPQRALVVVRQFATRLQTLANTPGQAVAMAAGMLTADERLELMTAVTHARAAASWDLVEHMQGYVAQGVNSGALPQDPTATTQVVQVGAVGDWLAYGAAGHAPVLAPRNVDTVLAQLDTLWQTLMLRMPIALHAYQFFLQQPQLPMPHGQDLYDPNNPT